jgi:putative PIN family toxin of toxin-antitoxin system
MIRAVLDTNVLISAAVVKGGNPDRIVRQPPNPFEWLTSEYILSEVANVLSRKHIQGKYGNRVTPKRQQRFLKTARTVATVVEVTSSVSAVPDDLKDNPILACGKDGGADYIVTGDRHLLKLGRFEGIQIVTPAEFLATLRSQ